MQSSVQDELKLQSHPCDFGIFPVSSWPDQIRSGRLLSLLFPTFVAAYVMPHTDRFVTW